MDERLYYKSSDEMKATFRGCAFGDDEHEVQAFLKDIEDGKYDQGGWAFRGVKSSKYKLLTSLQREWIYRGLDKEGLDHHDLVAHLINAARRLRARNGTGIPREIKEIEPWNELGLLSYLQHYDCPTPLLDFTNDIRVALFFAVQPFSGERSSCDLDEYVSVYTFNEAVMEVTNSGLLTQWRKHADFWFNDSRQAVTSYRIMTLAPILIHNKDWYDKHCGQDVIPFYNNERIQAQKGLFVSNSTAGSPVLEAVHDFVAKDVDDSKALETIRTYINCVSINRRFIPLVEEWLKRNAPQCDKSHMLPKRPEHDGVKLLFDEALSAMRAEVAGS